jgi:membrane-associated phospholipid phosphatase
MAAAQTREAAARVQQTAQQTARASTLPAPVAVARGGRANVAALIGLAGFGAIFATVKAKRSEAFDAALMMKWQAQRIPALARVMRVVSWPGFPPQSRIIPPLVMGGLWFLRFRLEAIFQLLAWGTGGLSTVLKGMMKRPRPVAGTDLRVVAAPLGGSSFPSGHVITYAGTYGWMAYLAHTLIRPVWPRRALVAFFAGLIALVGPSRIYQGHHWPTDVAASYLLGLSYFIGLSSLYRRFKRKRTLE